MVKDIIIAYRLVGGLVGLVIKGITGLVIAAPLLGFLENLIDHNIAGARDIIRKAKLIYTKAREIAIIILILII